MQQDIKIILIEPQKGELDLTQDTDFPLTFSAAEIKDISKRKSTFSKTIKLAGTKNNNILLNNYYDVNVSDGTFNINKLQKCIVTQNGVTILNDAFIQLVSVNKVQTTSDIDNEVEYEVILKDNVGDFFSIIGQKELTDLSFYGTMSTHTFSTDNVVSSFDHTYVDMYKYVMPQNTSSHIYNLPEFQPGIYVRQYWDKIFQQAGYRYSFPTRNNVDIQFDKLIIPYNDDKPKVKQEVLDFFKVVATKASDTTSSSPSTSGINLNHDTSIVSLTEQYDPSNSFNPIGNEFTIPYDLSVDNPLTVKFKFRYIHTLKNNSPFSVTLNALGDVDNILKVQPKIILKKNGVIQDRRIDFFEAAEYAEGEQIASGASLITHSTGTAPFTEVDFVINNLLQGDVISFHAQIQFYALTPRPKWIRDDDQSNGNILSSFTLNNYTQTILLSSTGLPNGSSIDINDYIPKKIKQSDFIKSICNMFNLVMDIDKNDPNLFLITTRDRYYDGGKLVDWTYKLNKDKEQTIKFLSEIQNKKLTLSYKMDTDPANVIYKEATKEIYGQQEFIFDNEYIKGNETKEIIFSPTPVLRTQFGAVVPALNGESPKTNIRILIDGGNFPLNLDWNIFNGHSYDPSGLSLLEYPLFSHFDDPDIPSLDINYGMCDYYFYNIDGLTNNNLFNLHYRRTFNQLNESRIMTAYFDLNEYDINKMRLSDLIRLDNSYYYINSIIDYNANKTGPTKVELISIDTDRKLTRFIVRNTNKNGTVKFAELNKQLEKLRFEYNNYTTSGTTVDGLNNITTGDFLGYIGGNNNNIIGDNGLVIGDSNQAFAEVINITGQNNTVLNNALVFGDNNYVTEDAFNSVVLTSGITASEPNTVYVYDLEVLGTINGLVPGQDGAVAFITASQAITDMYNFVDTSTVAITITLPLVADSEGKRFNIKDYIGNARQFPIKVVAPGGVQIDDRAFYFMNTNYESVTIVSSGLEYYIV